MRHNTVCPKCQGKEIIRIEGKVGPYWDGNNIAIGISRKDAVLVTRYVCSCCGYSEEWIEKAEDLTHLKEYFKEETIAFPDKKKQLRIEELEYPTKKLG